MGGSCITQLMITVVLFTSLNAVSGVCTGQATYSVTFKTVWTSTSHPKDYPSLSAHWSGLVGGSHNNQYTMWAPGGQSTTGMKNMAEFGTQSTLLNEMKAQGNKVLDTLTLFGIGSGVGTRSGSLDVDGSHSLVSLVSMIAPSPDWFVGVRGHDLCNGTTWRQSITVDLFPYDAGTDSGLKFTSANSVTNPKEPIFRLTGTNPNNMQSSFYGYNPVPKMATLGFVQTSLTTPTQQTTTQQMTTEEATSEQMTTQQGTAQEATTQEVTTQQTMRTVATNTTTMKTVRTTHTATTQSMSAATSAMATSQTVITETEGAGTTPTSLVLITQPLPNKCSGSQTYFVLFKTLWTINSHPKDFPVDGSWSGLIGGSHNAAYTMWQPGQLSTVAIEYIAEFGQTLALKDEMKRQGSNILDMISLSSIESATGHESANLLVDGDHSLVSLVSKITPSPDWFVGIHSVDLCDATTYKWRELVNVDLFPYDAGTDSGLQFVSHNINTSPPQPVSRLTGTMPNSSQSSFHGYKPVKRMATMTLKLGAGEPSGSNRLTAVIMTATLLCMLLLVM